MNVENSMSWNPLHAVPSLIYSVVEIMGDFVQMAIIGRSLDGFRMFFGRFWI